VVLPEILYHQKLLLKSAFENEYSVILLWSYKLYIIQFNLVLKLDSTIEMSYKIKQKATENMSACFMINTTHEFPQKII
jgi:hypothetical protein